MQKDYLFMAIRSLKPTSEFTYSAQDYSTIQWHVLEGKAPTKTELDAEIATIKADEATAEAQAKSDKAALLDRLGITAEEAALLLG